MTGLGHKAWGGHSCSSEQGAVSELRPHQGVDRWWDSSAAPPYRIEEGISLLRTGMPYWSSGPGRWHYPAQLRTVRLTVITTGLVEAAP